MQHVLSMISGLIMLVAFIPYIRAILRGETKPSKASWLIWATLDIITFAGMYASHTVNGQIVGTMLGAASVAILALKLGKPGWTMLDKICIACAVLAIVLWRIFDSPIVGLSTSLIATLVAGFPTFANAWRKPEEEDKLAWVLYWLSCVFAVAAIPSWTMGDAAQPLLFFANESVMVFILFVRLPSSLPD